MRAKQAKLLQTLPDAGKLRFPVKHVIRDPAHCFFFLGVKGEADSVIHATVFRISQKALIVDFYIPSLLWYIEVYALM